MRSDLREAGRIRMVKMFCQDESAAVYISSRVSIKEVVDIMETWGAEKVNWSEKAITHVPSVMNLEEFEMLLLDYEGSNIYLDMGSLSNLGLGFRRSLEDYQAESNTSIVTLE